MPAVQVRRKSEQWLGFMKIALRQELQIQIKPFHTAPYVNPIIVLFVKVFYEHCLCNGTTLATFFERTVRESRGMMYKNKNICAVRY